MKVNTLIHNFDNLVIHSGIDRAAGLAKLIPAYQDMSSPLFIHSESGIGKTHLARALDFELEGRSQYVTGLEMNNFLRGGVLQPWNQFREGRDNDGSSVLIIDGVHEVTDSFAQFQLKGILDQKSAYSGCSIVVTSSLSPALLKGIPEGLQRGLEGTICAINPPTQEERLMILRFWNEHSPMGWSRNHPLPQSLLQLLSSRIQSSLRRLRAAFDRAILEQRLEARHSWDDEKSRFVWTEQRVMSVLGDYLAHEETSSLERIMELICSHFDLTPNNLTSRSRTAKLARARQVGMFLARRHTNKSLVEIGEFFGKRHHGTVIHAIKQVKRSLEAGNNEAHDIRILEKGLPVC